MFVSKFPKYFLTFHKRSNLSKKLVAFNFKPECPMLSFKEGGVS